MSMSEEEEFKLLLETFEKNWSWFSDHCEQLEKTYANKVLAIKDQKVIAVNAKVEGLLDQLKKKNVDVSTVYVGSIPPKGIAFIL